MRRERKVCDLPYLPADVVEWHVAEHYGSVGLSGEFIDFVRRSLDEAAAGIQANVHTMHASYKKQLKNLAAQEERLVDLAADGAMPTKLIQKRLRDIQVKRSPAQAGLDTSTAALERGSDYSRST
jgi:hypothetical protein